jgi:hypothetical protein
MQPSGKLRRVALVGTDVSDERSASIIRVTRIGELGTTLAVTRNFIVSGDVTEGNEGWSYGPCI